MSFLLSTIKDLNFNSELSAVLENSLKKYKVTYNGILNEYSLHSCNILSSRFNDIYNKKAGKLVITKELNYPYMETIETMISKKKTLIWFGPACFLVGIKSYTMDCIADNFKGLEILETPDGHMVFCEIENVDIAERLYNDFNLKFKTYDEYNYCAFKNINEDKAKDCSRLFLLEYFTIDKHTVFCSNILNDRQIENAVKFYRYIKGVSRIDIFIGTYAAYLTMEQTNYIYPIFWTGNELWIDYSGLEFGEKIYNLWMDNITFIIKNGVIDYIKVNKKIAIQNKENYKSIWINGIYYLVVPKNNAMDSKDLEKIASTYSEISESKPKMDELQLIGYNRQQGGDEPKWSYPTLIVNSDGSVSYPTTYGNNYEIAKKMDDEVINKYLNNYFFTAAAIGIINSYTNFIPSIPPKNILQNK